MLSSARARVNLLTRKTTIMGIRLGRVVLAAAAVLPLAAHGQPAGPPVVVPRDPGVQRALEEQRSAFLAYQKCVADSDQQYRLYSASEQLINVRDNPRAVEYELATNPASREQFKGGYDEVIATALAHYQAAGGTASAAADVVRVANPCPPPGPTLPRGPR